MSTTSIIPIGLRGGDPRRQVIPPKIFRGSKRNILEKRGETGRITTEVTGKTKNKHDYWFTYRTGDENLRAAKVRYLCDEQGRIDTAYFVSALGKSKITFGEKGEPTKVTFKPHFKFQQKPGGYPLILRGDVESLRVAIVVKGESEIESVNTEFPFEVKNIERFTPDDLTSLEGHGKWEDSNKNPNDPRVKHEIPAFDYQLKVFLGHYARAIYEIGSIYKTFGASRFN